MIREFNARFDARLRYTEDINDNEEFFAKVRQQLAPVFDQERKFTAPWQSGITGIGFNRKVVGDLNSMDALFDPKYKRKVTFLSDARDPSSLVMLMNGVKPEEAKIDDVMAAIDKVDEANQAGQIRRFTGNDYTTDLTKGNAWSSAWPTRPT